MFPSSDESELDEPELDELELKIEPKLESELNPILQDESKLDDMLNPFDAKK